jgi:hypothetical protein
MLELRKGTDPGAVALQHGFTWQEAAGVRRDAGTINRAVVRAAFRAGVPAPGQTVFDGVSLGTGSYAIVAVTGVSDPDPGTLPEAERSAARKELVEKVAARAWSRFLAAGKSSAEVQIYRDNLQ